MNEHDYLNELLRCLSCIQRHNGLVSDLLGLLAKSGQESKFLSALLTALRILCADGADAVYVRPGQFEKLSYEKDLYSMHVNTKQVNCRILYTFSSDKPVLLYGFFEKQGHRKTDYSSATKVARSRMKEWRAKYE